VYNNELQTGRRLLGQFQIYPDPPCLSITGAPSGPHLSDPPFPYLYADPRLPFRQKIPYVLAEKLSVPAIEDSFSRLPSIFRAHEQLQATRGAGDHLSGAIAFDDGQSVAPAPNEVCFSADHLSLRLAFLLLELRLLSADPSKPTDHGQPNCIYLQTNGRRDSHPPIRWVNPNVQILDVLPNNLNLETSDLDVLPLSIHAAPSQFRKPC
jgi:hypothetical protein